MKKRFKIVGCECRENPVVCESLRAPKQNGRNDGADQDGCAEINQQSDCVFQVC